MSKVSYQLTLIFFIILGFSSSGYAEQSHPQKEKVRQSIESLFDACQKQDVDKAAKLIIYRGPDKKREWKSVSNPNDPKEKLGIQQTCQRINQLIEKSEGHEFKKFMTDKESEGVWHVYEVGFKLKSGEVRVEAFAFLPYQKGFALGDIDYIKTIK